MKKFLIFGGTLEGRSLSEWMSRMEWPHTVCVATEYGEEVMEPAKDVSVHQGRMNEEEMVRFLIHGKYTAVADATHPYAVEVSKISGRPARGRRSLISVFCGTARRRNKKERKRIWFTWRIQKRR